MANILDKEIMENEEKDDIVTILCVHTNQSAIKLFPSL